MSSKPKPQRLGSVSARAIRGPREDGRWYWRAEWTRAVGEGASRSLWSGWATEHEAQVEVARLLAAGQDRPRQVEETSAWTGLRTVDELLRAHLHHCETSRPDLRPRTVALYRERAKAWARHGATDLRLDRLSAVVLDQVRAHLLSTYSPSTAHLMFCLLGMAWTWARGRGYIEDRELRLPAIAVPKSRRPRLDYDEAVAIADRQHVAWRRVAILMMAVLGARRGEICDLTWDRVDLAGRWVELDGKTGPRRVPLPDHLVVELSRLPRDSTYMLGVVPSTARRGLASVLQGVGTHALRRGAVDRLARSGVDVGTAARLLGHSPTMMLEVYREVSDADLRAAVDTLASRKVLPLRKR